jgi:hypothetical protein
MKETKMFSMKNILAAASLAVLAAAGIGSAAAAPWDHYGDRRFERHDRYERMDYRAHATVSPWRIAQTLRFRGLRMVSEPTFFHGHMVVRAHDHFGRTLIVHVDPYSGDVMRVIRL